MRMLLVACSCLVGSASARPDARTQFLEAITSGDLKRAKDLAFAIDAVGDTRAMDAFWSASDAWFAAASTEASAYTKNLRCAAIDRLTEHGDRYVHLFWYMVEIAQRRNPNVHVESGGPRSGAQTTQHRLLERAKDTCIAAITSDGTSRIAKAFARDEQDIRECLREQSSKLVFESKIVVDADGNVAKVSFTPDPLRGLPLPVGPAVKQRSARAFPQFCVSRWARSTRFETSPKGYVGTIVTDAGG
jgi:hypothetical protein